VHVWRTTRAALNDVLAHYLGAPPDRFEKGPHGKPRLAGDQAWLRFNLSHSGEVALVGVARDVEVGIDVERIRPVPEMRAIARRWLGRDDLADPAEFFRAWTRHEAMLKALGVGLSGPVGDFAGFVAEIDAGAGCAAAVAVLAPACRVIVHDW
jgi:4'-phosphopantetheinyl transferase